MRTHFRQAAFWVVVSSLSALGWLADPPLAHAIPGIEGKFEYAIDAPWRLEPTFTKGGLAYGAIPVQISIHDAHVLTADYGADRAGVSNPEDVALGRVCRVVVRERAETDGPGDVPSGPVKTFHVKDLDEIETTRGYWRAPVEPDPDVPPHHGLCRGWAGQDCSPFDKVRGSSEWHASLSYRPSVQKPATYVSLQVEVHLTKDPVSSCDIIPDYDHVKLVNELRVYHAPAPLPRFGSNWIYGDLHYHAQGTDNDAESAYNYRGVIRAMGAMGIDFTFATDHASNSQQIRDADVDIDIGSIEVDVRWRGLRDISEPRFKFLHGLLHGPGGANIQAPLLAGVAGGPPAAPQVFLGGEVDLIPEYAPGTKYGDLIPWGNGQEWSTKNLCFGTVNLGLTSVSCESLGIDLLGETATHPDAVLVNDIQSASVDYARNHIVYLPRSAADAGAFVASDTGKYGGAGRRFVELRPEIERHGYFFAAHSLGHFELDGIMPDIGPTDPAWTDHLYDQAWRSPAWLGLQFWNEDGRLNEPVEGWSAFTTQTPSPSADHCLHFGPNPVGQWSYMCPEPGGDVGYERYDSPVLGIPYATLPVDRAQAGFGSGLFHLQVEAPITGRWPKVSKGVEEKLHHGAFTWDRLNHWGLNLGKTLELDWLPSFLAPRRLFMAGGSDAHGDLNYRRTGYMIRTDGINDTAFAKPRNLVEVDPAVDPRNPKLRSQDQVTHALADGRFSITDGPALRIAVDRNGNGVIDAGEPGMGDVVVLQPQDRRGLPLLVEWKSTDEFGGVRRIDIYVGARSSEDDLTQPSDEIGRTYAPYQPGVIHTSIPGLGLPDTVVEDPPYDRMNDNYWRDPTGLLGFTPLDGMSGVRRIFLDLGQFPAMRNVPADRFFVRAFAVTETRDPGDLCVVDHEGCLRRYAFANPIWVIDNTYACGAEASLDATSPETACNAPATTPADRDQSFAATAVDACPVSVELRDATCAAPSGPSRPGEESCKVTVAGNTLTIAAGVPAGTVVRWTAAATDAAGNRSAVACQTEVRVP
jgi:hypothetical protein